MFVSCPQCDTHYKLSDLEVGATGRKVRCTNCRFVWLVMPEEDVLPHEPAPGKYTSTAPIADEDMSMAFHEAEAENAEASGAMADDEWPDVTPMLAEGTVLDIPETVKPLETPPDAAANHVLPHYMPAGMSANVFGATVFLLPFFITAGLLIAFKAPLVRHFPALAPVYKLTGLPVAAPGDGLRLSALVAERRIGPDEKTLNLTAQLANVSPVARPYPSLKVTLRGPSGDVVKAWDLPAPKDKTLASGEETPIKVEFKEVPDTASKVEVKVGKE